MPTLVRALVDYDLELLRVIASQWDVDLASDDRALAAEELAADLVDADAVIETWQRLNEQEQEAMIDLLAHEGRIPFMHFVRRYGEIRPMGPARREREKPWLEPVSVTESLYYRGLIVRSFEPTSTGAQEHIVIPSDLGAYLPQIEVSAISAPPGYAVAPPRRLEGGQGASVDDAATILGYLLLREVNTEPWFTNTPVEAIDQHLRRGKSPAYRAMLLHLLHDLGMIGADEFLTQRITTVNKDASRPWLEAPRLHQLRSLAETWRDSTTWNDLAFTPGLDADKWPNDPRLARQVVLETLAKVPTEIWWSLDGFIDHIKQTNPDFQRAGGDYGAWYLRDVYTGEIIHGFQYWDHVEGALIRFILEGPMRWMGLVQSAPGAFALTPLGVALIGRQDWPSTPDQDSRISIDPQGVITVPAAFGRYERVQLSRFTAWISPPAVGMASPRGESDDGVYLYRITAQALERVREEGITIPTHIIPFLQRHSGHSIPQNVLKMLEAWHAQPDEVIVQDAVILTSKDLGVYERLRKDPRVARWMGQQIGPHAHAVRRDDMPALLNALREAGILPLFADHEKDDWP
jgi:hypothetical protein